MLRAAAAAATAGVPIDRPSLERLGACSPVLDGPWPEDARLALVDLLATGPRAIPVLESLDQRGLVHRVLPEWEPNRSRPQRNAYHRFTVDRHLCEAAANAAALTTEVSRPDLLLVGTWLHDLGKGYPGDHTEVGMELMAEVAPRMGFADDDVATLVDMVRHHLLLPDVATRRDLADDDVIEGVAAAVGSLDTLELLAALTEADSLATGPSAWGTWKAGLVAELVERVAHVLRGGAVAEVTAAGFPSPEVRRLLAEGTRVVSGEGNVLTVVAPDRPGLFSRVAGTLALKAVAVRGADAVSADGMAASRFVIEPGPGGCDWDDVATSVGLALDGRLALAARVAQRSSPSRAQPRGTRLLAPPRVRVDNPRRPPPRWWRCGRPIRSVSCTASPRRWPSSTWTSAWPRWPRSAVRWSTPSTSAPQRVTRSPTGPTPGSWSEPSSTASSTDRRASLVGRLARRVQGPPAPEAEGASHPS